MSVRTALRGSRALAFVVAVAVLIAAILAGLLIGPVRIGAANVFGWLVSFGRTPSGMSGLNVITNVSASTKPIDVMNPVLRRAARNEFASLT